MSFNVLLLRCLTSDRSLGEKRAKVSMPTLESGEVVLFFDTSKQAVGNSLLRKDLEMKPTDKLCDGIIIYCKNNSDKKTICLIELKGRHTDDAVEQLISTRNALEQALNNALKAKSCLDCSKDITWLGIVAASGGGLPQTKSQVKRLKANKFANADIVGEPDISDFIRQNSR